MVKEQRLINANEAYEAVIDLSGQAETKSAYAAFWKAGKEIQKLPTVDAVEVVHGRWIAYLDDYSIVPGVYYRCSECCDRGWGSKWPYCPNCGAKMDGGINR